MVGPTIWAGPRQGGHSAGGGRDTRSVERDSRACFIRGGYVLSKSQSGKSNGLVGADVP